MNVKMLLTFRYSAFYNTFSNYTWFPDWKCANTSNENLKSQISWFTSRAEIKPTWKKANLFLETVHEKVKWNTLHWSRGQYVLTDWYHHDLIDISYHEIRDVMGWVPCEINERSYSWLGWRHIHLKKRPKKN